MFGLGPGLFQFLIIYVVSIAGTVSYNKYFHLNTKWYSLSKFWPPCCSLNQSKIGSFGIRTEDHHLNTRYVGYSDPHCITIKIALSHCSTLKIVQWGSEIRTSLDFEWSKRGWVSNGLYFEWDLKCWSPTIWNLDKWPSFCQKTWNPNHLKSALQKVRISNVRISDPHCTLVK